VVDVLELVQLKALVDVLGPTDGPVAWSQVRDELAQPFLRAPLDVVFDTQIKHAAVIDADADLRSAISHGRPVRVVAIAERRQQATDAFRRLADVVAPSSRDRSGRTRRSQAG
jgi:hypothetical protein